MTEFREIATGLRFPEGPIALPDGTWLVVEIAAGRLSRIAADGSVSVVADTGGGPNGAAIGPDGRCYVCNNGGMRFHERDGLLFPELAPEDAADGWIDAIDLDTGDVETLYRNCEGRPLRAPNDIVFDGDGGMWFTDHGKTQRRIRDRGAVYYARPDGSLIKEVVSPLEGPNGIGLSPDGTRLYVAETPTGRLWSFAIAGPGEISRIEGPVPWARGHLVANPSGYLLFDSLAVDAKGHICVGTIPGAITIISPDGSVQEQLPLPDLFPTNICFGGPDMETAFITLSSTGRLVAVDWPSPGLPLHFLN
jgi:gluconolactonase